VPYESTLDKVLLACDELTGFVGACALVRPEGIATLEAKSVLKKLKDKGFAAKVERDEVSAGAALLGVDLGEHVTFVIEALKPHAAELGLTKSLVLQCEERIQELQEFSRGLRESCEVVLGTVQRPAPRGPMTHEPTLFDRMTPEMRQAMEAARGACQRMGHAFMGPEHFLLGLIEVDDGAAMKILAECGCQTALMKSDIEARLDRGVPEPERRPLPFTPKAKRVLEESVRLVQMLDHAEIGTGHVLFSLAIVSDTVAFDILLRHRVSEEVVCKMLDERGGWEWPFEPAPDDVRMRLVTLRRAVAVLIAIGELNLAEQVGRLSGHSVQP